MSGPDDGADQAGRATAMARSVEKTARRSGLDGEQLDLVRRAHALAMQPRLETLEDDHHAAYLHPGRSVLVLLRDVGPTAAGALAAAALHESEDADLRVPIEVVEASLGSQLADSLRTLPLPGDDDLLERLVTLPEDLTLALLAERLDHSRHLHLRSDLRSEWVSRHEEVVRVWLPIAERAHRKLAVRFAHWVRVFAKRIP